MGIICFLCFTLFHCVAGVPRNLSNFSGLHLIVTFAGFLGISKASFYSLSGHFVGALLIFIVNRLTDPRLTR